MTLPKPAPSLLFRTFLALALLAGLLSLAARWPAQAHTGSAQAPGAQAPGDWAPPVNLSRSGAASNPRLLAGSGDNLQAFWWDQFDGLVTLNLTPAELQAGGDLETGSAGLGETALAPIISEELTSSPYLAIDATGWVHAFWFGRSVTSIADQRPLLSSRLLFGTTQWTAPETLAESALAFEVSTAPDGSLSLAYVRSQHTAFAPAGVYVKHSAGGKSPWGPPVAVYKSIYFRLLNSAQAHVSIADLGASGGTASGGSLYLTWHDPRRGQAFFATSTDSGLTWSDPISLGEPDQQPVNPRILALPPQEAGGSRVVLRLWQAAAQGECVIYQQQLPAGTPEPDWTKPIRVLEYLDSCPQGGRILPQGNRLYWVWNEGTPNIAIAAWDSAKNLWSRPAYLSVSFIDPESGKTIALNDLHATFAGDHLAVTGSDPASGEVWATLTRSDLPGLLFAPPSPWLNPQKISLGDAANRLPAGIAALAVDSNGMAHITWGERSSQGAALVYSRWDPAAPVTAESTLTKQVQVITAAANEKIEQPAMIVEAPVEPAGSQEGGFERIHLVWSGGANGQIFYSRARINEALSVGGWSPAQILSSPRLSPGSAPGSFPKIGIDAAHNLYVIYTISINEGRGVYLVKSTDAGATWGQPVMVFDAAAAGWQMISDPALAVSPEGGLHIAFVQTGLDISGQSAGLFYIHSAGGGERWSSPLNLAGPGYAGPRLAITGRQINLLYANPATGGVWHRWVDLDLQTETGPAPSAGNGWSAPVQLPGWQNVPAIFALTVDSRPWLPAEAQDGVPPGTLHLTGVENDLNTLIYSIWSGANWANPEKFLLSGASPDLTNLAPAAIVAAARPTGGVLAVAWLTLPRNAAAGQPASQPALHFSARAIPTVVVPPLPTPQVEPTPTVATRVPPTPTVEPSPTPNLAAVPVPTGSSLPPVFVAAGLAACMVVGILVSRRALQK